MEGLCSFMTERHFLVGYQPQSIAQIADWKMPTVFSPVEEAHLLIQELWPEEQAYSRIEIQRPKVVLSGDRGQQRQSLHSAFVSLKLISISQKVASTLDRNQFLQLPPGDDAWTWSASGG